jgi:hypothetical protein
VALEDSDKSETLNQQTLHLVFQVSDFGNVKVLIVVESLYRACQTNSAVNAALTIVRRSIIELRDLVFTQPTLL